MSSQSPVEPLDATGPSGESKPADSPLEIYRHSSAHLLAAAVTELFPEAQCGIGPPTDDGFFYDFLVSRPFTPEDLVAIEKKMAHIVKQNRPIEKKLLPEGRGARALREEGPDAEVRADPARRPGEPVQCYTMGEFIDFCLRAAPRLDEGDQGLQAEGRARRRVLEGQGRQPVDAAHLRLRLLHEGRAGRAPAQAGGGQAPRPPQAGPGAGPVLHLRRPRAAA